MKRWPVGKFVERTVFAGSLGVLFLSLSANNACQEDYFFATQSNISATVTPTPTPTEEGDSVITPTGTPTEEPTETPEETEVATATATGVATAAVAVNGSANLPLLMELQRASEKSAKPSVSGELVVAGVNGSPVEQISNWLGNLFGSDQDPCDGQAVDSDGDGFTDVLERGYGTNSFDSGDSPRQVGREALANDEDEGRVIASGSPDSDGDGLPDALEIELGTSSVCVDTDLDGILDGKEYALGLDPLVAELRLQ